jgi:hypothetical protein
MLKFDENFVKKKISLNIKKFTFQHASEIDGKI